MSYQMDASEDFTWIGLLLAIILMVLYIVLNKEKSNWRTSSTLLGISVIILIIGAQVVGIVSTVLLVVLGIYYIVEGSKNLDFPHLNYGSFLVGFIILLRFLDSELGLFIRGMIFIMLGCIFLGVTLYFI